jgi:hypothetical protein
MNNSTYNIQHSTLFIILLFAACAPQPVIFENNWQNYPVKVDGKATEWEVPLQYYDNDTKLNYTITNDDSNLYYCIRITDDKQEMRVMKAGMQVRIDTSGKKVEGAIIEYPFSATGTKKEGGGGNHNSANGGNKDSVAFSSAHSHFKESSSAMHLAGFLPPVGGITPVPNVYGIQVCIARDSSGVMLYEAKIPFKTFYKPCLTNADKNKVFGITFVLNAMTGSGGGGHHGGGGGMGGGGMGGGAMGGGGMGGHGMGGGGGGHRGSSGSEDDGSLSSETLSFKIKLATSLIKN